MLQNLRNTLGRLSFNATTLEGLASRCVHERWAILPPEAVACPEILKLPIADEAGHLRQETYKTPAGELAVCSGLLYYTQLNSIFADRRTLVLDGDNAYQEHPSHKLHRAFYWKHRFSRPIRRISGYAMPFRSAANNYYHTLVDNLPRLWALHHPDLRDVEIQILISWELQDAERFFVHKLLPPNARMVLVENKAFYKPDRMLVSSFLSRQMCGFLPRAWLDFFRQQVLPQRRRNKRNRIYISRRESRAGRRILNECELAQMLSSFGFERVELESLSIAEQVELFFDAEMVIGAHGAGLTNLLFSDRATVLELHPAPRLLPHFYFLCLALGHDYHYWCGAGTSRNDNFSVDVQAVRNMLTAMERPFVRGKIA